MKTPQKEFWKIEVATKDPFLVDQLSDCFFSLGAKGVEEILKRRKVQGIRAYLETSLGRKRIQVSVEATCGENPFRLSIVNFRDKKWIDAWKKFLKPVYVGGRIFVRHDHKEALPNSFPKNGIVLDIKPTFAFGTGQHATTFLCLKQLLHLSKEPEFPRLRILDLGCGTGILALAAYKLGAKNITALDVDPMAIAATRENMQTHQVKSGFHLREGSLSARDKTFDLIVANIMLQTHLTLCRTYQRTLKKNGRLILSGLLRRQEKEMLTCLRKHGFQLEKVQKRRGWIRIDARKK